jgi:hypothetical protein
MVFFTSSIIVMATRGELLSLLISESNYSERPMVKHMVDSSPVISCITLCSSTGGGKECTPISFRSANDVQTVQ